MPSRYNDCNCKPNGKSYIFLTFANQDQKPYSMLRVIATFILIYLIFRLVITFVVPWVARWYLKRVKKKFYRENPWAAEAEAKRKAQYRKYQESQKNRRQTRISLANMWIMRSWMMTINNSRPSPPFESLALFMNDTTLRKTPPDITHPNAYGKLQKLA